MGTYPSDMSECQRSVDKTSCPVTRPGAQGLHYVCCILCNCLPLCVLKMREIGGGSDNLKGAETVIFKLYHVKWVCNSETMR